MQVYCASVIIFRKISPKKVSKFQSIVRIWTRKESVKIRLESIHAKRKEVKKCSRSVKTCFIGKKS